MTKTSESTAVVEAPEMAVDPFLDMVERVATNEAVDPDKLQKLLDMQERILDRQNRQQFFEDMNNVQANMPSIVHDAWNDQTKSRYAKLQVIVKALRPVYTKYGFSISFTQEDSPIENHIRVRGRLAHKNGWAEGDYHVDVPIDDKGIAGKVNKTLVHATGSSFTYGRRYLTCMMFDIATGDDDDGQAQGATFLEDEDIAKIAGMLTQLLPEEQKTFWKRARAEEDDYEALDKGRMHAYLSFLKGKGAVENADS